MLSLITMNFYLIKTLLLIIININLINNLKINNLHEINSESTSITVGWSIKNDDINDNDGDDTHNNNWIGYKLKYTIDDDSLRAQQILIDNLNETKYRLNNLKPFTEYKIQVSAYNKLDEEGPASSLLIVKTHESVPGPPQDLFATKTTINSIEIEWKPPKREEQNGIIKAYQIQYAKVDSQNNEFDVKNIKLKANQQLKYILSNLDSQTLYTIRVFAINSKGDGSRSTPIFVSTKESVSTKPENIYTQLSDDELRILWSEPSKLGDNQKLIGYRVNFNNEYYNLNETSKELILKRPKWEFNRKYDLRISAKLNDNLYGEEAVYILSTNTNFKNLNLTATKISSTSVLLKWNVDDYFSKNDFKIEYFTKSNPKDIKRLNNLTGSQLILKDLKPKSVYFVQLVSDNEQTSIIFETSDVDTPNDLIVTRADNDKVNVKWNPIESNDNSVKGYRVYYAEYGQMDYDWKQLDVNDAINTNIIINLSDKKSYVFQVAALDRFNNEGKKSDMVVLYENKEEKNFIKTNENIDSQMTNYIRNDEIGIPRDLIIIEYSSTSVKFGWYPPNFQGFSGSQTKRHSFLIQYVDRPKVYRDSTGQFITDSKGTTFKIYVPGRDDLSMRVMWMLNGLMPDTIYDFNITTLIDQTHGPPVSISLRTKRDRPAFIEKPILKGIYEDDTVLLRLGNASEKNGPIARYWLIVVPNNEWNKLQETRESELTHLLKYSLDKLSLTGKNLLLSNESAYITAEFDAFYWPNEFLLGNEKSYGRFVNRKLIRGIDYKVYSIAFTDETPQTKNTIDLADVFTPESQQQQQVSLNGIGDLFTASQYSDVFNTKPIESKPIYFNDYQNLLWIGGAVSAIVFILILITSISIHLMNKKRKSLNQIPSHNTAAILSGQTNTITTATTSSSASPTTLLLNTNAIGQNTLKSLESSNKAPLGLLTTVQPMYSNNITPSHYLNNSENLYTSIDITQRQFLLSTPHHDTQPPPLFQTTTFQTSTLSTASSNFDPIELRRLQFGTLGMQTHPPLHIDELASYIDRLKLNNNEKFAQEYESIDTGQQFTWETSTLDFNRAKNRYANVIAYDHSRVVLSSDNDYINANYCDGYRKRNAYIATQGPLPSTYGDFWRMVWEQRSSTIVMMTKLEERSRLKCDQYWPSKGVDIYDCMQIALVDLTELATYSVRTFIISNLNYPNEPKREIKHFQYTAWPDHGVPDHATPFLMFLRRVRFTNPPDAGPLIVHCSAGVGRTGCFIVIDTQLERLKCEQTIDIYAHVTCLRAQRNFMVQTEDQYVFCYDAVLEAVQNGNSEILARNLYTHLERLLQTIDENCTLTEMELEYKRLSNAKAPQSKFLSANLPANKFKNRLVNILPYETTRVTISLLPNPSQPEDSFIDGSDYINASFIDGYKHRKAYIATQAPLNETIDDFWRMLWEVNSNIIVMLTKLREMGREKCAQYWPQDRSVRYQYFVIDPIAEYNMTQYVLREFKMTDARDGQSRTIRQFQFNDWPEQGVPKSGESIIELIGQVHKTKEQFGLMGPITVHCSAGVGRTGVFITLSIVLERMRFEGVIDVFNTVKMLRAQRPAMVQTEDQYQFCYRAALEYLGSFDNYDS